MSTPTTYPLGIDSQRQPGVPGVAALAVADNLNHTEKHALCKIP